MNDAHILTRLRKLTGAKYGGQSRLARAIGISRNNLCDILAGRRTPGPRVLAYLGLQRTHSIVRRKR